MSDKLLVTNDSDDKRRGRNYCNKQRGKTSCTAITSSPYLSLIPTAKKVMASRHDIACMKHTT